MAITISPYALIDLDTMKSLLGIPMSDTTKDAKLTLYINAATAFIESQTDRQLVRRAQTDVKDGRGSNKLLMYQWPVSSVTSIYISSARDFTSAAGLIDPSAYAIIDEGSTVLFYDQSVPYGYGNVQIKYVAGFDPLAVPADLVMACAWTTEWYFRFNENRDIGRSSRSKGDENSLILQDCPPTILRNILQYKRTEFPSSDSSIRNW